MSYMQRLTLAWENTNYYLSKFLEVIFFLIYKADLYFTFLKSRGELLLEGCVSSLTVESGDFVPQ